MINNGTQRNKISHFFLTLHKRVYNPHVILLTDSVAEGFNITTKCYKRLITNHLDTET